MAIDLSSLLFRSFYGLPTSIKDADGFPINGVKGYLETLIRLKNTYSPEIIIHALDDNWRPDWRTDLLPQYKAHRVLDDNEEEVDEELERQIKILPQILNILGMQCIGKANFEADDVLASIANHNSNTLIVSGDKDLFQTVNDKRSNFVHLLGKEGGTLYTEKIIKQRFGIDAKSYLDYSVLKGDPSDGLPGVKGIGEKTALEIILKFGNIDNLLKNINDTTKISLKQQKSIADSVEYINKALKVVKLKNNLKIKIDKPKIPSELSVTKKLEKYRIDNQINKFFN
ncbi:MAG: 5'-3' exonuclease [Candidatus Nanopelagicales bacterium]